MWKFTRRNDEGFTIVELLVVLTVIGILSGIAYVGLNQARSNSIQDSCKAAFQAVDLGVASYQTDHGGYMPGSITALEPNYVSQSTLESYSKNFSLKLGSFSVVNYSVSNGIATLTFANDYVLDIAKDEKLVVAGVSSSLDGTHVALNAVTTSGAGTAQVSFAVNSGDTSGIPAAGAYLNAISNLGDPFDIHVIDLAGHRIGTAPKACSSL